jgi:hypothetical protein
VSFVVEGYVFEEVVFVKRLDVHVRPRADLHVCVVMNNEMVRASLPFKMCFCVCLLSSCWKCVSVCLISFLFQFVPIGLKAGETVLLSESYNGTELNYEGKDYTLYREDDILAVLDKN